MCHHDANDQVQATRRTIVRWRSKVCHCFDFLRFSTFTSIQKMTDGDNNNRRSRVVFACNNRFPLNSIMRAVLQSCNSVSLGMHMSCVFCTSTIQTNGRQQVEGECTCTPGIWNLWRHTMSIRSLPKMSSHTKLTIRRAEVYDLVWTSLEVMQLFYSHCMEPTAN